MHSSAPRNLFVPCFLRKLQFWLRINSFVNNFEFVVGTCGCYLKNVASTYVVPFDYVYGN